MKTKPMRINKEIKLQMLAILEEVYKDAKPALNFTTNFELLIAVVLSAQCTDARVNITTARLFKKANTPKEILNMGLASLENEIRDCGLFKSKAKNIIATCEILINKYNGEVPNDFEKLVELPGVGRKTANVVLSIAFDVPAIAVDTHVFRVSNRTKLAIGKTPEEVERKLQRAIPKEKWSKAHHILIWHGRKICTARKAKCEICPIKDLCPTDVKSLNINV